MSDLLRLKSVGKSSKHIAFGVLLKGGDLFMGVKYKSETNALPELTETLSTIGGRKVVIGALKGKHAWL